MIRKKKYNRDIIVQYNIKRNNFYNEHLPLLISKNLVKKFKKFDILNSIFPKKGSLYQ